MNFRYKDVNTVNTDFNFISKDIARINTEIFILPWSRAII